MNTLAKLFVVIFIRLVARVERTVLGTSVDREAAPVHQQLATGAPAVARILRRRGN